MATTNTVLMFVGIYLEGIFYGIYCVIFGLYLGIQLKRPDRWKSVLLYALTATFILCTAYSVANVVQFRFLLAMYEENGGVREFTIITWLAVAVDALFIAIDLISQLILFYRCWIMWRRPLVLVVPGILSLAFIVTALTTLGYLIASPGYGTLDGPDKPHWFSSAVVAFFSISLVVNALLTGLIVYKIVSVYRDIRGIKTRYGGSRDLHPVIPILVESGMMTFVGQLVQSVMYKIELGGFAVVSGLIVMLYGISTTVVLVRVEMGVSYDHHASRMTLQPIHFAHLSSTHNQTTIDIAGGEPTDSHLGSEMKLMRNV